MFSVPSNSLPIFSSSRWCEWYWAYQLPKLFFLKTFPEIRSSGNAAIISTYSKNQLFLAGEEDNVTINKASLNFCAENFIYLACGLPSLYFCLQEIKVVLIYCVRSSKIKQKLPPETQLLQQVTHFLPSQNSSIPKSSGFTCGSTKTSPAYLHWFKEIFAGLHISRNITGQLTNA